MDQTFRTIRKAEAPVQLRQALETLPEMAVSAIEGKGEATSRGWPTELDNKKNGSGRSGSTGIRQTSEVALFAT
jgi:hypothetical protein